MKKGDIVIAPDKCQRWLTPGREYTVVHVYEHGQFSVRDDEDNLIYTNVTSSAHLNYQDWIIKDTLSIDDVVRTFEVPEHIIGIIKPKDNE